LEKSNDKRSYDIKGGKLIQGKIFAYQEKTGMSYNEIMKLPYITFVLGMLDAPQVDYDSKKETPKAKNKKKFGTPIKDLPIEDQKKLR